MVEPYVEHLHAALARLDALTGRERAHPERPTLLPASADHALLWHLSRGIRASRRALAMPPLDALGQAAWAAHELWAASALLEEWAE